MTNENTTQATLNAWQARLEQVRQRRLDRGGGHAGLAQLHQVQGKTGLQVMTALLEGHLPHPYMADTFDCELVELGDGHAVFQATPQLKHYNSSCPRDGATPPARSISTSSGRPTPRQGRFDVSVPPSMSAVRSAPPKRGLLAPTGSCMPMQQPPAPSSNRRLLRLDPKSDDSHPPPPEDHESAHLQTLRQVA